MPGAFLLRLWLSRRALGLLGVIFCLEGGMFFPAVTQASISSCGSH
jgi:hypothetical protein